MKPSVALGLMVTVLFAVILAKCTLDESVRKAEAAPKPIKIRIAP